MSLYALTTEIESIVSIMLEGGVDSPEAAAALEEHLAGMDAALACRVLGGQAEGVPAHRVHDHMAPRPLVPRDHVTQRVVAHMSHVDLPAGVREHLKNIKLLRIRRWDIRHGEAAALLPGGLPPRFGLRRSRP